jgi:2-oxoglutarate dehydrogenase E1 component
MGAATFVTPKLEPLLPTGVRYDVICRAESASPATGSHKAHVLETKQILNACFNR